MQQQTSVSSKKKEADDIKAAAESINGSINKLIEKLDGVLNPKPPQPPAPGVVVPELVPPTPPKKSMLKELSDDMDKCFGFKNA